MGKRGGREPATQVLQPQASWLPDRQLGGGGRGHRLKVTRSSLCGAGCPTAQEAEQRPLLVSQRGSCRRPGDRRGSGLGPAPACQGTGQAREAGDHCEGFLRCPLVCVPAADPRGAVPEAPGHCVSVTIPSWAAPPQVASDMDLAWSSCPYTGGKRQRPLGWGLGTSGLPYAVY